MANSSFAAVQEPGDDRITLFYVAANGTLFNAIGSPTNASWRMGDLAPSTKYAILVSEGSGIAAQWWGLRTNVRFGYSLRVYFVERASTRVQELAYDGDKEIQWFVTDQALEVCSPQAKIALAHLQPASLTNKTRETMHLFYEGKDGSLRHFPGYNGFWGPGLTFYNCEVEVIDQNTTINGGHLAATVYDNDRANCTLRVWFIDDQSRLSVISGLGQSNRAYPNFNGTGTFGDTKLASGFTKNYVSSAEIAGGSIAAVNWNGGDGEEQFRLYYRANVTGNNGRNGTAEIGSGTNWLTNIIETN
ncbi:hypothetical protein ABW20_dc0105382 [Dactylellina cionopaga]|nr:hypothetical protein ABW20_dc0105382 [Dactylellina cionopaga]